MGSAVPRRDNPSRAAAARVRSGASWRTIAGDRASARRSAATDFGPQALRACSSEKRIRLLRAPSPRDCPSRIRTSTARASAAAANVRGCCTSSSEFGRCPVGDESQKKAGLGGHRPRTRSDSLSLRAPSGASRPVEEDECSRRSGAETARPRRRRNRRSSRSSGGSHPGRQSTSDGRRSSTAMRRPGGMSPAGTPWKDEVAKSLARSSTCGDPRPARGFSVSARLVQFHAPRLSSDNAPH